MRQTGKGNEALWGAGRPGEEGGAGAMIQLASFFVGAEEYALDIMRIKEIINPLPLARAAPSLLPFAPEALERHLRRAFERKGDKVVEANVRGLRLGREAGRCVAS